MIQSENQSLLIEAKSTQMNVYSISSELCYLVVFTATQIYAAKVYDCC